MTEYQSECALPIIDFSPFLENPNETNQKERQRVAQTLHQICRDNGFFTASNIGITENDIKWAFDFSAQFFSLPVSVKNSIAQHKDAGKSRENNNGYVQLKREKLDPSTPEGDLKEALNVVGEKEWIKTIPDIPDMKENIWNFLLKIHNAAIVILSALEMSLNTPKDFFKNTHGPQFCSLRFLHYPQCPKTDTEIIRAGAHDDYGTITLLWQDGVGGLQIKDKNTQKWVDIKPVKGVTAIVNTGGLLARWTNDIYQSTVHRVVEPPTKIQHPVQSQIPERYSIAYFVHPHDDYIVQCLESCSKEKPPKYNPVSALDYLLLRFSNTY